MNESDNSMDGVPSSCSDGQAMPAAETPALVPEAAGETVPSQVAGAVASEAAENDAAPPSLVHREKPEPKVEPRTEPRLEPRRDPRPDMRRSEAERAAAPGSLAGTALVVSRPGMKAKTPPRPEPGNASQSSSAFPLRRAGVVVAIAAGLGGLAGSLATAGIAYLNTPPPLAPVNYTGVTDTLGRINRELTVLKAGIDNATRATNQQVAKIVDRMDRAEKAQAEAGSKLAKASDVLDRVERRLAVAPPAPTPSPPVAQTSAEVTGSLGDTHIAAADAPLSADGKHAPSSLLAVDGWVLRDVYRGAALIQGHGSVVEVLPGDQLPGVGRIEQIKRQDGHWVVVTSRGLILPRL